MNEHRMNDEKGTKKKNLIYQAEQIEFSKFHFEA